MYVVVVCVNRKHQRRSVEVKQHVADETLSSFFSSCFNLHIQLNSAVLQRTGGTTAAHCKRYEEPQQHTVKDKINYFIIISDEYLTCQSKEMTEKTAVDFVPVDEPET